MDSCSISDLKGLGAKSAAALSKVDICTAARLRGLGAVDAYVRLIKAGHPHNLNMLWALEGAVTGRDWRDVAKTERLRLLLALDATGCAPP
ncbi:MAG: hypothetical protein RL341_2545 [Pseudomonadota bacterium]|jgi:DNA transformation protein